MNNYKKNKKRITALSLSICLLFSGIFLPGCANEKKEKNDTASANGGELVLRIANCEEYIDEGDWNEEELIELEDGTKIIGEDSLMDEFEDWYEEKYGQKVKVEYSSYGYNEELYNQLSLGSKFDVVCTSEYMIMKLMDEGRVEPLSDDFFDSKNKLNYYQKGVSKYINDRFRELSINDMTLDKYAAGYMWGTMGIVYNPQKVDEKDTQHWDMLLNEKYRKQITMKDGVRDSYFAGLGILNAEKIMDDSFKNQKDYPQKLKEVMNDTSEETVNKVEDILSKMRINAYSLENDSGKADMVTGKVVANMQWSGDATYSMDQADEDGLRLLYAVPKECTNLYFDGWCMLKEGLFEDSRKKQAAEAWMNFISREDNVIRNMYYTGYTSVIAGKGKILQYLDFMYGAESDDTMDYPLEYFFGGKDASLEIDKTEAKRQIYAAYPPKDILDRSAVMAAFSDEANKRINRMWTNIRCFDLKNLF